MKKFIEDLLEKRKEVYLRDPTLIVQDYNSEKKMVEEYDGRQLLEMLQNANDACITDNKKVCYIELKDNTLIIANNGKGFDEGGIRALMYIDISDKQDDDATIGKKGLGFRSIISWAKSVTVKSNGFALEFSRENAIEFLDNLVEEKPSISDEIRRISKKEKHPIAFLRCPKLVDIQEKYNQYDTYIVLKLKDDFDISVIEEQIEEDLNLEVLLFLNHLTTIIVNTPSHQFCLSKTENHADSTVEITRNNFNTDEITEQNIWTVLGENGFLEDRYYELKVAWDNELRNPVGTLYSYFKTEVQLDFPCLVHGTFDLTADRNHFVNGSLYNKALMEKLVDLLIKAALSITKNEVSYKPLKMLQIEDSDVDFYFRSHGFFDLFTERVQKSKVFPTIGNKYISIDDNPRILYHHNYSDILPSDSFPNLLQYTTDDNLIGFIKEMGVVEYDRKMLFEILSAISHSFTMRERASLITYLFDDYSKTDDSINWRELPSLLVDENESVIPANVEKFRKPDKKHSLPFDADFSIVHPYLTGHIDGKCIRWFGVRTYSFQVAFDIIYRRYISEISDTKKDFNAKVTILKEHLVLLNKLYVSDEKMELENVLKDVYVINRNGTIIRAKETYFGEDYGCDLCERLFHYNQDCFLASPRSFGLSLTDEFGFFSFLGVAAEPRRIMVGAEKDYLEFALRNYPYEKKKLYNKYSSFEEVRNMNYSFTQNQVECIQDLDSILRENSNETILLWLYKSSFSKTEMNNNSLIEIDFSRLSRYCYIQYSEMPSYILWKIGRKPWLKTMSGKKTMPSDCCLSKTLTKEFSSLVGMPKINYDSEIFKDNGMSKTIIDSILQSIYVKTKISDIDYRTVYSILRSLPEKDEQGEVASLIYQQLATNYNVKRICTFDWVYTSFIYNGFVFCKMGKIGKYCKVRDAIYISQNRNLPEDFFNHFWTIDIPKRFSEATIKDLFGVKAISNVEFFVTSFQESTNNNDLTQEFEQAKPLFYALKVDKDEDNKILQNIRNLKIKFCKEIKTSFKVQEHPVESFILGSYEYVCCDNLYYLYLDEKLDFSKLKFSNTIAQIVAECIGDTSQERQEQYSTIFEHLESESDVEEIFNRAGFGWESVTMAKERMEISDDPKTIFWMDILSVLGDRTSYYQKITEQQLSNKVKSKAGIFISDFPVKYDDIKDEGNIECLSFLFDKLGISVTDFNHHSSTKLKFLPYYKKKLLDLRRDNANTYAALRYHQLKRETEDQQSMFLDDLNNYKSFDFDIPDVVADIRSFFYTTIEETFGVNLRNEAMPFSVNDIFNEQKRLLIHKIQKMPSPNKELLDGIVSTDAYRSLICFGRFDRILKEYEEKNIPIGYNQNEESGDSGQSNDRIREIAQGKRFKESSEKVKRKDTLNSSNKPKATSVRANSSVGKTGQEKSTTRKSEIDDIGKTGELMVVDYLIKHYGKDNVLWESRYAQEMDENVQGSDNNHYDIRYKNNNGEWIYVEVKSSKNDVTEFSLTRAESEFGIENKGRYELFHITNLESDNPTKRVFRPFDSDNFLESKEFTVVPDGFVFKYEVESGDKTKDDETNKQR